MTRLRWTALPPLVWAAAGGIGCGDWWVGRVPEPAPGAIAWTYPGVPVSDGSPNVYVAAGVADTPGLALLDRARGVPVWEDKGPLRFRCFGPSTVVLSDFPDGVAEPGNYRAAMLSSADGTLKRMLSLMSPTELSCWPGLDRVMTVENIAGGPYVTAYIASAAEQLWKRAPTAPLSPPRADVAHVDAASVYVSWYMVNDPAPGGTSALVVQRDSDGESTAGVAFGVHQKMDFLFDAASTIFAVDNSTNYLSLRCLDAQGLEKWQHAPPSADLRVVVDGSPQFLAVLEGEWLLILDKATGTPAGDSYRANPDGRYASWDARFTRSGDVHVIGRRGATATHTVVSVAGQVRFVWSAEGRPNAQLWEAPDSTFYRSGDGAVARIDGSGDPIWTFAEQPVDRVIGADRGLVITVGPPTNCKPCSEQVIALDAANGHLVWMTSEPLPSPSTFFAADDERIYLSISPADFPPGRITAIWR